ncbi:hypothetical protein N7449_003030 [Penicillium cf. viridicatum]|uniref:Uncharacterized protein n=1 Tax=Penicillium cf. viridicatum TaxID=2972119 RepID=A0A9W9MW84_9EURO|nr:hypothetical protein N7449_003030 [Penicillium cf. viridicatum]
MVARVWTWNGAVYANYIEDKWIKTRSNPPSDEHTVQCFSDNSARHSDCVSTADGVPSAVIRTGQTRVGQALDSRQDKARQERHRLVVE